METEPIINQKEYLKKYLAIGKAPGEKRKKKKFKNATSRVKIIDDDAVEFTDNVIVKDPLVIDEDAPQIVAIIDERPPSLRVDEKTNNPLWQPIGAPETANTTEQKQMITGFKIAPKLNERSFARPADRSPPRRKKASNDSLSRKGRSHEYSPPRKKTVNDDHSPPRKYKNDDDNSPPRIKTEIDDSSPQRTPSRKRLEVDDISPPRRGRTGDISPPRQSRSDDTPPRKRRISDDYSPPRKSRSNDISPPRKHRMNDTSPPRKSRNDDMSPPRKSRSDDTSPPRKSRSDDISPPRKYRSDDVSPPRKSRNDDMSPPRKSRSDDTSPPRKSRSDDISPPRKYRSDDVSPPRKSRNDDISPPRKRRNDNSPSKKSRQPDNSSPRRKKSPPRKNSESEDFSPPRKHDRSKSKMKEKQSSSKMETTLEGKKAGLQDAKDLAEESKQFRSREEQLFKNLSKEVSGENAETVFRDRKSGKIRNLEEEEERQRKKREEEEKNKEKYSRWGRGLVQVESRDQKIQEELYEMSKPLARYADDEDLEKYLKEQEREGDPMLAYIRSKKRKKAAKEGKVEKPQFEGQFMPNRFGIKPGHRWDGVDRSNGYEKKWFEVQNAKQAQQEDSYKWSTEDM